MKSNASLADRLRKSMDRVHPGVRDRVNRPGGLSEDQLLRLILQPEDHRVKSPEQPPPGSVREGWDDEECRLSGLDALEGGRVAYCVLAGGAGGTRIGEPKALLGIPNSKDTLLSLKLRQAAGAGPIWVVTNHSLLDRVSEHVSRIRGIDLSRVRVLEQHESYRLTPDNQVNFIGDAPDLYPCGHGDVFSVLSSSGVLPEFANGGRCVQVVNVDNAVSALDPVSVGRHLTCKSSVSFEVVRRRSGDSGGFLCEAYGVCQVVEGFRVTDADTDDFEWLSTNTFTFDAGVDVASIGKRWHRVQKNVDGELLVQHDRLSQEITEAYDTAYLAVDRSTRFHPIKSAQHLTGLKSSQQE